MSAAMSIAYREERGAAAGFVCRDHTSDALFQIRDESVHERLISHRQRTQCFSVRVKTPPFEDNFEFIHPLSILLVF